jgi:hypothetical protein
MCLIRFLSSCNLLSGEGLDESSVCLDTGDTRPSFMGELDFLFFGFSCTFVTLAKEEVAFPKHSSLFG